ncbi:MAG: type II secretion system F family protein [Nitrospirae bacterium]|nr:type II secretion system F family protein [Nitrospirota bacterium]
MPIFQYKGYKTDGAEATGTIEAEGLKDAVSKVKDEGIFPKEVTEHVHRGKRFFFKRHDAALLPAITRHLSILISSGVPLIEALRSLTEESKGLWKEILMDIREKIAGGSSLSKAMSRHENVFPKFYTNMITAGEASGNLAGVLSRLSDFLEKQDAIKNRIRIAMIYPLFMVIVGFVVLSFLFMFVVPKIVRIFEDTKSSLPVATMLLIYISNFFKNYWWIILAVVAGSIIGLKRLKEKNPLLIDRIILRIPGNIILNLYLARFARTFGFLLEGGIPMLRALEFSSRSVGNRALGMKIQEAGKRVSEGAGLSSSLEGFPPVFLQLVSTGEKTGKLIDVMNKAADSYEDDFSRSVQKALSLLEPSIILVMGVIVGFIVFAVLLPMFQLNQLVK